MDIYEKVQKTATYLKSRLGEDPQLGIVLGTGLGRLVKRIEIQLKIPYEEIPHFPSSTVESHSGELMVGSLGGKKVVAMSGRFHYYEGYSSKEITFPVRVMKELGIEKIILSNASGGLNAHYEAGQIVLLSDHINLMPDHPLRGQNDSRLGVRFPDMKKAYPMSLRRHALEAASEIGYDLKEGVYVGLQGPSLETPAEYLFLHRIGGDMVGMSTVPEVLVAKHCELPVLVFSLISNVCFPLERIQETSLQDVIDVVGRSAPVFCDLVEKTIERM